jgi:hypothetical protein
MADHVNKFMIPREKKPINLAKPVFVNKMIWFKHMMMNDFNNFAKQIFHDNDMSDLLVDAMERYPQNHRQVASHIWVSQVRGSNNMKLRNILYVEFDKYNASNRLSVPLAEMDEALIEENTDDEQDVVEIVHDNGIPDNGMGYEPGYEPGHDWEAEIGYEGTPIPVTTSRYNGTDHRLFVSTEKPLKGNRLLAKYSRELRTKSTPEYDDDMPSLEDDSEQDKTDTNVQEMFKRYDMIDRDNPLWDNIYEESRSRNVKYKTPDGFEEDLVKNFQDKIKNINILSDDVMPDLESVDEDTQYPNLSVKQQALLDSCLNNKPDMKLFAELSNEQTLPKFYNEQQEYVQDLNQFASGKYGELMVSAIRGGHTNELSMLLNHAKDTKAACGENAQALHDEIAALKAQSNTDANNLIQLASNKDFTIASLERKLEKATDTIDAIRVVLSPVTIQDALHKALVPLNYPSVLLRAGHTLGCAYSHTEHMDNPSDYTLDKTVNNAVQFMSRVKPNSTLCNDIQYSIPQEGEFLCGFKLPANAESAEFVVNGVIVTKFEKLSEGMRYELFDVPVNAFTAPYGQRFLNVKYVNKGDHKAIFIQLACNEETRSEAIRVGQAAYASITF